MTLRPVSQRRMHGSTRIRTFATIGDWTRKPSRLGCCMPLGLSLSCTVKCCACSTHVTPAIGRSPTRRLIAAEHRCSRRTRACSRRRSPPRSSLLRLGRPDGEAAKGVVESRLAEVLPAVDVALATEVPRLDGTDRWRQAVGAQRGGEARSRHGDGRRCRVPAAVASTPPGRGLARASCCGDRVLAGWKRRCDG
jgi:hypothetical protein